MSIIRALCVLTVAALVTVGVAVVATAGAVADGPVGPAPIEQRNAQTVTTDPLPTVQIDSGIVWAQVIAGDTAYAGGSFSNARPANAAPGTSLMPRSNILAYDVNTGVATSFAPVINGTVKALALSTDGRTLYVGGSFTQVDGQARYNLAAFDTATGALAPWFKPAIGGSYVNAIVATSTTVYVGGLIGAARGVPRKNLAAVTTGNGQLLGWAPTTDLQVDAMVLAPSGDRVVIAGRFGTVNDVESRGLGALDPVTGDLLPWQATATIKNGKGSGSLAGRAGIWGLATDASGAVYGTAWVYADTTVGNLEGLFSADGQSGAIRWIADCHGDHYGVYSDGTNVYSVGHEHDCQTAGGFPQTTGRPGNMRNATVYTAATKGTLSLSPVLTDPAFLGKYSDWSGYPAPAAINWYPDWTSGTASGQGQAGWTITGDSRYVVVGGEFPFVNGKRSQGIARFAVAPPGGPKGGPRLAGTEWVPAAKSIDTGVARIQIPVNWDRDDLSLTYELRQPGATAALAARTARSTFWNRPTQVLVAGGFAPGSTQAFTVVAKDADGNIATSAEVSVVIADAGGSPYATRVLDDGASLFWRLGTSNAVGHTDLAGTNAGVVASGVNTTGDDALVAEANGAATFNGTTAALSRTAQPAPVGSSFALELWFKTATTSGGMLAGYGNATSGSSTNPDRQLFLRNDGRLVFGIHQGVAKTVVSPASYTDNAWHHAVAQLSPESGLQLFVDGALVADDATVTASDRTITGYWRLGGDTLAGWPGAPAASYLTGRIDEFAVYPQTLSAAQILGHYARGAGLARPTASFSATGSDLTRQFDAAASTVPAGRAITGYAWDFGDGASGAGRTVEHVFPDAGTYRVALTVTDDTGATDVTAAFVTATRPHAAPTAVVTSSATGLTAAFDGSASNASGGATLTDFTWDFGDGASGSGPIPRHAYAAPGTYPVTLRVTDSLGFEGTASAAVTVTHAAPIAAFTTSTSGLAVTADAASSSASDGAGLTYRWSWGDGTPTSGGAVATHDYEAAGVYAVVLQVTDDLGATATASQTVAVAPRVVVASDDFTRTSASGWGTAARGGAWTAASGTSVAGGAGRMTLAAGQTCAVALPAVQVRDLDAAVTISADPLADGGGLHANLVVRKSSAGEYRLKLRTLASGAVSVSLTRLLGTTETTLVTRTLTGYTSGAGDRLRLRLTAATDSGVTSLAGWAWPDGTAAPAAALVTASDARTELAGAGQVGITGYLSGTTTNGPVTLSVDDLAVVDSAASAPPSHADPTAAFTAATDFLALAVDASGSAAADGATLTYRWDWGDGTGAGAGVAAAHTYAAAGTYPVTLTLTDSFGAVASLTKPVVAVAPPEAFVARDDFTRSIASGWGSAPAGGAWSGAAGFSVDGSAGRASVSAAQTRTTVLAAVSAQDVDARLRIGVDRLADGGGSQVSYLVRRTSAGDYRLKVRIAASGSVQVSLAKLAGTTETVLTTKTLSGSPMAGGAILRLRLQATTSSGATTLQAKAWADAADEPSTWLLTAVDAQPGLQGPGQIGMSSYVSGSATNGPVTVRFDDLEVR